MSYSTNLCVIAAICGNFWGESTINPGIWENLTVDAPGYGLGGWTDAPPYVYRRTALFNWLDQYGYPRDSGDGQLAFLIDEDIWVINNGWPSDYATLTDFLNSTDTNVAALTEEWMHHWEGIDDASKQRRIDAAEELLDYFQNDDGTRWAWVAGNFYNSWTDAKHNALLIMDFFLGGVTPIPPIPAGGIEAILALIKKRRSKGGYHIVT